MKRTTTKVTPLRTKHTPYATVSKGSNNLHHWSSINGSHFWIINISGSLGLFLSEQVSLSSLTLPSSVNSPDSHAAPHTIHSISSLLNTNLFTGIQWMLTWRPFVFFFFENQTGLVCPVLKNKIPFIILWKQADNFSAAHVKNKSPHTCVGKLLKLDET